MNDSNGSNGPMGGSGSPGMSSGIMASARRRAIRQSMHPTPIKHGLVRAPHIDHPRDNQGPQFGLGGGFKSSGF